MTTARTSPVTEPPVSLRERKKLPARGLLRRVALELVAERGLANVTIEDIAEAADISPRTFFNYFPTKEDALFGRDPGRIESLRDRLLELPKEMAPFDAVRTVLVEEARATAEEILALGSNP